MANIIKIKRGSGVPGSGVLAGYELGWDSTNNSLYLGVDSDNPIKIADAFAGHLSINKATGKLHATGAFEVDGNAQVDGTLTVVGNSSISTVTATGLASLDGGIDVNGSKFTVDAATGNVSTLGTLTSSGATSINNTLTVIGDNLTSLGGNLAVTGTSTLTGNVTAQNNFTVNGNTVLGNAATDTLTVNATSTFAAPLNVSTGQLSSLDGGVDVNSLVTISATTGNIVTSGDITSENATINGNLIVHGTTTTVNSTTVEIADPIFTLGETLAVSDAKDRGIEFNYGTTTTPKVGFFGLDESTGRFVFIPEATNTSEVFSGITGDFEVGNIYQSQLDGGYSTAVGSAVVNASDNWNAAAKALGISGGTGGITSGSQYDLLQADVNGNFVPTTTIPSASGITIDCGTY